MLRDVGVSLQKRLEARSCPIRVVDGLDESPVAATFARERIVLDRDPAGDGFKAARGSSSLARRRGPAFRLIGCRAEIYVREPRVGALPFEHVQRAEKVLDHVVIALDEVLRGEAKCRWQITGGAFEAPPDLAESERLSGARYVLRFQIERGLLVQTWKGQGPNTKPIGTGANAIDVATSTSVGINGAGFEPVTPGG